MKFKWFRYPVDGDGNFAELNEFLASHPVTTLRKDWVQGQHSAILVFLVEYSEGTETRSSQERAGSSDATKGLDDFELALFNRLRDVRKQIAEAEAVPVWSLFGNQALRLVVKQRPESLDALAAIPGVGKTRADKHGERLLSVLRDVTPGSGVPLSSPDKASDKKDV